MRLSNTNPDHVRAWAHSSAHESKFNPWSQNAAVAAVTGAPGPEIQPAGEPEKDKPKTPWSRRAFAVFNLVLFRSWLNVLLVFVPAGIAVHFAGINQNAVFALNAIAVIPLAGLLTFATECVAHRMGPTLGALINVSFGNAVELIIFIIALVKNEIRVVQAALIGSILANLLLILGMAFLVGGLEYKEQVYDSTVTQMSACLLAMAVLSLLIPTAFHASFNDVGLADTAVLKLSRGTSVILLVTYVLYLAFQLKSHAYLYQGTPQHIVDAHTEPGIGPALLQRFDSTGSSSTGSSTTTDNTSTTGSASHHRKRRKFKSRLGMKRKPKVEFSEPADEAPVAENGDSIEYVKNGKERVESPAIENEKSEDVDQPTPLAPNTGKTARPQIGTKGLSFRAPPVFRASSTYPETTGHGSPTLRRLKSTPNQNNAWVDVQPPASGTGTNIPRVNSNQSEKVEADEPPISQTSSIILLLISTGLVALCAEFMVGSIEHLVQNSPISEAFIGLIILPIVGNAAEHVTAVTVAAKNKMDLALGVALGSSIQIALFVTPLVVLLGWILSKDMSLYFSLFETVTVFVSTFVLNFLVLDGRSNYLEGALLMMCYVIIAVGAYLFPDSQNQNASINGPGGS